MSRNEPEPKDVSANELRELLRVFTFLADFAPKHKLRKELQPRQERKSKIMAYKKNPDAVKIVDETGAELSPEILENEFQNIEAEMADLERQIEAIDSKPDHEKKIHPRDLQQALAFLGKHTDKVCNPVLTTLHRHRLRSTVETPLGL